MFGCCSVADLELMDCVGALILVPSQLMIICWCIEVGSLVFLDLVSTLLGLRLDKEVERFEPDGCR